MFGIIKIFVLIYDTGKINFSFETGKKSSFPLIFLEKKTFIPKRPERKSELSSKYSWPVKS